MQTQSLLLLVAHKLSLYSILGIVCPHTKLGSRSHYSIAPPTVYLLPSSTPPALHPPCQTHSVVAGCVLG